MEPGATPPVDIYPLFHWLPQSLYRNWITTAKGIGADMNSLYSDLLTRVRKRRESKSTQKASVMDMVLDQNEKFGLSEHQLYFLGGVLVEGGSETTSSVIQSFIHAMTKWPGILQNAQAEIDAVVGEERTPIWEDYDKLPYVAATVKEAMRWRPAVPLAFPHATVEGEWKFTRTTYNRCIGLIIGFKMTGLTAISFQKAHQLFSILGVYTETQSNFLTPTSSIRIILRGRQPWPQSWLRLLM